MTLNDTIIDREYIIEKIDINGKEKRRLYDLGLVPDNKIIKRFSSMFKDPNCYEVGSIRIAIRNSDAKQIRVKEYE